MKLLFWLVALLRDTRGIIALMTEDSISAVLTDVNVEPTNLCNAKCVFCGYQFQTRPHSFIESSLAYRIIDSAREANVKRLGLTPIVGEPLFCRYLEDIIRHAKKGQHPMMVGLTTNGIALDKERYRSLIRAGVDSINISMTFPDNSEYAKIYRNHKFGVLVKNINDILEDYQPGQCNITIAVRTARRKWMHPLFTKARSAGWTIVKNKFMDDWSGRVADAVLAHGFALRPLRARRLPCSMLYSGPHFLSDGRASACGCRDLDGGSELSLDTKSLLEDLRKEYTVGKVEKLREMFRTGNAPEICSCCRHYNPYYKGQGFRLLALQLISDLLSAMQDLLREK